MKTYEYQILRFIPDRVSGEFVNIGLVLYQPEEKDLKYAFISRISRVSSFFNGINARYLLNTLRHFHSELEARKERFEKELEFDKVKSVEEITSSLIIPDDTSIVFSEIKKGIDVSLDAALSDLSEQLLYKFEEKRESEIISDEDVWSKVYRKYFEELNIREKLTAHKVNTAHDAIEFDYAWKNKHWHCYKPISFNLKRSDSVKNKVYRWLGKMQELKTTDERISIDLLSVLPKKKELKKFIIEMLNEKQLGNASINIVEEKNARKFAEQLKLEMDEHPS